MLILQQIVIALLCTALCLALDTLIKGFKYIWVHEFGNKWGWRFWEASEEGKI